MGVSDLYGMIVTLIILSSSLGALGSTTFPTTTTKPRVTTYSMDRFDCIITIKDMRPGTSVRLNAWTERSYKHALYESCKIRLEPSLFPLNGVGPVFRFNFDTKRNNYIDNCNINLNISHDASSTSSDQQMRYNCTSALHTNVTRLNTEYLTVELSNPNRDRDNFDFSIVVSFDYSSYRQDGINRSIVGDLWKIIGGATGIIIFVSIVVIASVAMRNHRNKAQQGIVNQTGITKQTGIINCVGIDNRTGTANALKSGPENIALTGGSLEGLRLGDLEAERNGRDLPPGYDTVFGAELCHPKQSQA